MNLLNNLEDWGQVPDPYLFSNLLQLLKVKIKVFHFFAKVNKRQLKIVNINY